MPQDDDRVPASGHHTPKSKLTATTSLDGLPARYGYADGQGWYWDVLWGLVARAAVTAHAQFPQGATFLQLSTVSATFWVPLEP